MVQKPDDLVIKIHGGAGELLLGFDVKILHRHLLKLLLRFLGKNSLQTISPDFKNGLALH